MDWGGTIIEVTEGSLSAMYGTRDLVIGDLVRSLLRTGNAVDQETLERNERWFVDHPGWWGVR